MDDFNFDQFSDIVKDNFYKDDFSHMWKDRYDEIDSENDFDLEDSETLDFI